MQNANEAKSVEVNFNNKDVAHYYNYTRRFYRIFWHGKTNALHYGFNDETTKTSAQELIKTIELTAKAGNVSDKDIVADLGCGVGGSAFWIAKHCGARVRGITLSESQCKKAARLSHLYGLQEKTDFKVGDYFETGYETASFDVVFGLEALCYGQYDVERLVKEMYRITKKGGRAVVTDGFLGKESLSSEEKFGVGQFCEGFVINKMIPPQSLYDCFRKSRLR